MADLELDMFDALDRLGGDDVKQETEPPTAGGVKGEAASPAGPVQDVAFIDDCFAELEKDLGLEGGGGSTADSVETSARELDRQMCRC
jgi:hypothetical protein